LGVSRAIAYRTASTAVLAGETIASRFCALHLSHRIAQIIY
jgi:hypothetical protein